MHLIIYMSSRERCIGSAGFQGSTLFHSLLMVCILHQHVLWLDADLAAAANPLFEAFHRCLTPKQKAGFV